MDNIVVEIVKVTEGWVLLAIFAMYIGFSVYRIHSNGKALDKTLNMLDITLTTLVSDLKTTINNLGDKIERRS